MSEKNPNRCSFWLRPTLPLYLVIAQVVFFRLWPMRSDGPYGTSGGNFMAIVDIIVILFLPAALILFLLRIVLDVRRWWVARH